MFLFCFPPAHNANLSCCCEDWTCSLRHGKGADAACCMLGAWGLSLTCACSFLPWDSTFDLPRLCLGFPPLQISACPCFRKHLSLGKLNMPKVFLQGGLCSLRVALCGMCFDLCWDAFWSKTLFINVLSTLKLFKSQGLLHNPTFWSWECGKVLPWFFVGFSLILNVDFLSRCVVCDCFIPLYNCCFLSPK